MMARWVGVAPGGTEGASREGGESISAEMGCSGEKCDI